MDSSRTSSSSSSSHHYSALLGTVSELRNDLEKSITKMNALEEQNQQLQNSYQVIKGELIETRKKYNASQENYMSTVAAKFDMERQNESFMEMLKLQLAEKTKEFEAVRDKFAPQDVDFIRIKIQEELEVPHRQKLQSITNELEQYQDNYNTSQREVERIKAEYEVFAENQQREMVQIRHEHEAIVASLRSNIMVLEERQYAQDKDEMVRQYKLKNQEFENTIDSLRSEIKGMQQEHDDTLGSFDKEKSRYEQTIVSLRNKICVSDSERNASNQRVANLTLDLETKDTQLRNARKSSEEQSLRIEQLTNQLTNISSKLQSLKEDHNVQLQTTVNHHESIQRDYLAQMEEVNSRLLDREDTIRKLQRETGEFQIRSERKENDLKKEFGIQTQSLKQHIHSLELECMDLKSQLRNSQENLNIANTQNETEIERLRNDNARILREKDMLLGKLREGEQRVEMQRKKDSDARRALMEKLSNAQQDIHRLNTSIRDDKKVIEELNKKLYESEINLNKTTEKVKQLGEEHTILLDTVQKQSQMKFDNLATSYKEKLQSISGKYKHSLDKEKKKSEIYKGKAIEAHNMNKILTNNMETMQAMANL